MTNLIKLNFPKKLTSEEEMLKSKYAVLRHLKQKLLQCNRKKEMVNSEVKIEERHDDLKKMAARIIASKGGLKNNNTSTNSTRDFKRPSSQTRELQAGLKRSAKKEYFPEADGKTRSVAVRGLKLTQHLLRRVFGKIGEIWNIRHSEDCAIVTFKTADSAVKAVQTLDGSTCEDGQKLSVQYTKKKNSSWKEILAEDRKVATDNHVLQKKRTLYVSCKGSMTIRELRDFFRNVGLIENIYMSKESRSNQKKSHAFVTFAVEEDAEKAVKELDGVFWKEGVRLHICPQKIRRNDDLGASAIGTQDNFCRDLVEYP